MGSFLNSIARFTHPHYVVNLLLSLVFFGLKTVSPICDYLFEDCELELVRHIAGVIVRRIWSICAFGQTRCAFGQVRKRNHNSKTNPNPNGQTRNWANAHSISTFGKVDGGFFSHYLLVCLFVRRRLEHNIGTV